MALQLLRKRVFLSCEFGRHIRVPVHDDPNGGVRPADREVAPTKSVAVDADHDAVTTVDWEALEHFPGIGTVLLKIFLVEAIDDRSDWIEGAENDLYPPRSDRDARDE